MVAISLLVVALVVVVCVVVVSAGLRFLSRGVQIQTKDGGANGSKEVSIKTPFGSLEARKGASEAQLGLPIYPGAERLKESATVNLGLPDDEGVHIAAAKFQTGDPLEKVRDFYKQRLGSDVTRFRERTPEGKTVFEIKNGKNEKAVALSRLGGGTVIEIVHVTEGKGETN